MEWSKRAADGTELALALIMIQGFVKGYGRKASLVVEHYGGNSMAKWSASITYLDDEDATKIADISMGVDAGDSIINLSRKLLSR